MEEELVDFTHEDALSSISIEVEGQMLHVHKEVLAIWSPVFKSMFLGAFRESRETCISLPGKKVEDIIELLHCIYPPIKPINDCNVGVLLPLVEEYQVLEVKKTCEEFLLTKAGSMELLLLGQQYSLNQLVDKCVEQVKQQNFSELQQNPCFEKLQPGNLISILQSKVADLEQLLQQNRKLDGEHLARLFGMVSDLSSGYGGFCSDCKPLKISDTCMNCLKMFRCKVRQKCDEARASRNNNNHNNSFLSNNNQPFLNNNNQPFLNNNNQPFLPNNNNNQSFLPNNNNNNQSFHNNNQSFLNNNNHNNSFLATNNNHSPTFFNHNTEHCPSFLPNTNNYHDGLLNNHTSTPLNNNNNNTHRRNNNNINNNNNTHRRNNSLHTSRCNSLN